MLILLTALGSAVLFYSFLPIFKKYAVVHDPPCIRQFLETFVQLCGGLSVETADVEL